MDGRCDEFGLDLINPVSQRRGGEEKRGGMGALGAGVHT